MSSNPEPEQIKLTRRLVEMSAQRTEMSAERCYQNAERTLSVWIRTALGLMIFGIAIDRFGLLLHSLPGAPSAGGQYPESFSSWCGIALVALGVLATTVTGLRFVRYANAYRHMHTLPDRHGPYLATFFAAAVAVFGLVLLTIMLIYLE